MKNPGFNDLARVYLSEKYKFDDFKKPHFPLFVAKPESLSNKNASLKADTSPPAANYKLRRGEKELAMEIGSSPFNPSNFTGPKEYDVYGRDYYNPNLRFGRVIGTKGAVTYQYFFSLTPLAVFTKNEVKNPAFISEKATPHTPKTKRETTYGVGVQPLNFRFFFLPEKRWKPYVQVGAGILLTNKAVPVPRSQPFNLTGDFGGGLFYFTSRKRAVSVGYRYFHISNGNVGGKINNPGYNANIFSISYSLFYDR